MIRQSIVFLLILVPTGCRSSEGYFRRAFGTREPEIESAQIPYSVLSCIVMN